MHRRQWTRNGWRGLLLGSALFGASALAQPAEATPPASPPQPETAPVDTNGIQNIEELDLASLLSLDTQVTTASGGQAQQKSLAAANVESITRDEIERHGWRSLSEILSNTVGLYVVDDLVQPSVGVRGVTSGVGGSTRIIKVMINGVAVNFRPDLQSFLGPEYIPAEAIERVEIAKGPLSALYGANAFLAVVNVITRTPEEKTAEVAARGGLVNSQTGAGGSFFLSTGGKVSVLAAASYDVQDRSGLSLDKSFSRQLDGDPLFATQSVQDYSRPLSAFLMVNAGDEKVGTIQLQGGYQRLDANANFQLNSLQTGATRYALQNLWANARYQKSFGESVTGRLSLGYSSGGPTPDEKLRLTGNPNYDFQRAFDYRALDAKLEVEVTPTDWLNVKGGADYEFDLEGLLYYRKTFNAPEGIREAGDTIELIGATDLRHEHLRDLGVYLQVTGTPVSALPNLHLTANGRVDVLAYGKLDFPVQPSWRLSAAYRFDNGISAKLIGGAAFQVPSGVLLFASPGFGGSNNLVGNAKSTSLFALKPQHAQSGEVVVGIPFWDGKAQVEASAFYQHISDQVKFVQSGADFVAANRGDASFVGGDLTARVVLSRLSPYLSLSLERQLGKEDEVSNPAPLYPSVFGVAGADLDIPEVKLRLNGQVRSVGRRGASQSNVVFNSGERYSLPAYTLVDLAVSTNGFTPLGNGSETRFTLSVRNLLDHRYDEPGYGGYDVPVAGRTVLLELRQIF